MRGKAGDPDGWNMYELCAEKLIKQIIEQNKNVYKQKESLLPIFFLSHKCYLLWTSHLNISYEERDWKEKGQNKG